MKDKFDLFDLPFQSPISDAQHRNVFSNYRSRRYSDIDRADYKRNIRLFTIRTKEKYPEQYAHSCEPVKQQVAFDELFNDENWSSLGDLSESSDDKSDIWSAQQSDPYSYSSIGAGITDVQAKVDGVLSFSAELSKILPNPMKAINADNHEDSRPDVELLDIGKASGNLKKRRHSLSSDTKSQSSCSAPARKKHSSSVADGNPVNRKSRPFLSRVCNSLSSLLIR